MSDNRMLCDSSDAGSIVTDVRAELTTAACEAVQLIESAGAAAFTSSPAMPGVPVHVARLFDAITDAVLGLDRALQLLEPTMDHIGEVGAESDDDADE